MKVVVPYANDRSAPEVHYCVRLNLEILGIPARWVRMTDPNSYALLFRELWSEGEKFVIVEHDVLTWRGAIEEVWNCPEPFCGFDGMLTCSKFIPEGECPANARTGWHMLDGEIHRQLFGRGVMYHDHVGHAPIINLNPENAPGGDPWSR